MDIFRIGLLAATITILAGCGGSQPETNGVSLLEARRGFATTLLRRTAIGEAPETPPPGVLNLVSYDTPLGKMAAYLSPPAADGKRRPAIIWLVGGFSNSISPIAWTPGAAANDQSASGFRDARIAMLYPSLRGGNHNPGHLEAFYGEVDDVLAAAEFLAKQDGIDADRIYLGGHSTGGTLALLVAASGTGRFRAVFALGPVDDVSGYGDEVLPFDLKNAKEVSLRSPKFWLGAVRVPTFVFEGLGGRSNIGAVRALGRTNRNEQIRFLPVPRGDHFSIIAPLVKTISRAIQDDHGKDVVMNFDVDNLLGANAPK